MMFLNLLFSKTPAFENYFVTSYFTTLQDCNIYKICYSFWRRRSRVWRICESICVYMYNRYRGRLRSLGGHICMHPRYAIMMSKMPAHFLEMLFSSKTITLQASYICTLYIHEYGFLSLRHWFFRIRDSITKSIFEIFLHHYHRPYL